MQKLCEVVNMSNMHSRILGDIHLHSFWRFISAIELFTDHDSSLHIIIEVAQSLV